MRRHELEHLIRAAGAVADESSLIVVGSQAVLGQFPSAPADALKSMEADLIPLDHPERWNLIDGVLGEGSPFHEQFGYYADGLELGTAVLPEGWRERLIPIRNENTRGVTGLCLEVHDLLISKYVAGRQKDLEFCTLVLRHGMADFRVLRERLERTSLEPEVAELVRARMERDAERR
jgi:hypothetical protein